MKISILGYSASGKSTLAGYLGKKLGIPVLYLDKVQFEAGWQVRKNEEAVETVKNFMQRDSWVIDGNYSFFCFNERIKDSDLIIIMKFSAVSCLARACRRYKSYKGSTRESMAEGCNEKLDAEFVRWILHDGRTKARRKKYRDIEREYAKKVIVIKNQRQLDSFEKKNEYAFAKKEKIL